MIDYEHQADALLKTMLESVPQDEGHEQIVNYLETQGMILLFDISVSLSELSRDYCKDGSFSYDQIRTILAYNTRLLHDYIEFVRYRMEIS